MKDVYRVVLESIHEGCSKIDPEGKIVYANTALTRLARRDVADLSGTRWSDLLDPPTARRFLEKWNDLKSLHKDHTFSLEGRLRRSGGSLPDVKIFVRSLTSSEASGRLLGGVVTATDISSQVASRRLFEQMDSELRDLERFKQYCSSLLSHDLQTPLAATEMVMQFLLSGKQGPLTEFQKKSLLTVSESTTKMMRMISDLLEFIRLEEDTLVIQPRRVDLNSLVESRAEERRRSATKFTARLCYEGPSELLEVSVDDRRMKQALDHLLSNAQRHARSEVVLRLQADAQRALISVEDDGPGVPEESMDQIFRRFVALGGPDTAGRGLGLFIVREIVHAHGGQVTVANREKGGARFQVALPM